MIKLSLYTYATYSFKKRIISIKIECSSFLKGWGVDAEVKSSNTEINQMSSSEFTLNTEIWKDNEMSGSELRKNAWNRK